MLPQAQQRKRRNSSRVNLIISLAFHTLIILALFYLAARQGLLGKQLKKIAVEMVKEKPPEKPKEKEKPKTEPQPNKVEQPKVAETPKTVTPKAEVQSAPAPTVAAPPAVAPPAVDVPSFVFEGGKAVQTTSDPVQIYRGLIESALRSRWNRPDDIDDEKFVAEVEVSVDRHGDLGNPEWKQSSGNKRWDESVREALQATRRMDSPPPTNFPAHVLVRFDVQELTQAID